MKALNMIKKKQLSYFIVYGFLTVVHSVWNSSIGSVQARRQAQESQRQRQQQPGQTCPFSLLLPFHDDRILASALSTNSAVAADDATTGTTTTTTTTTTIDDENSSSSRSNEQTSSSGSIFFTSSDAEREGIAFLAIAWMAMEDFNRRMSSLVPEISSLPSSEPSMRQQDLSKNMSTSYQQCQAFFPQTLQLVDTGRNPQRVRETKDLWFLENGGSGGGDSSSTGTCAVVGPMDNYVAQAVGTELLLSTVPVISIGATSPTLTNGLTYPNLVMGMVNWGDTVLRLCQYVVALDRRQIGVLFTPGDQLDNDSFVVAWENAFQQTTLTVRLAPIYLRSKEQFTEGLRALQNLNVFTIVVALERDDHLQVLADAAKSLGMISEEHIWIFMDSFISPQHLDGFGFNAIDNEVDPTIIQLLDRTRLFQLMDGLVPIRSQNISETSGNSIVDVGLNFLQEWEERGSEMVNRLEVFLDQSEGMLSESNITIPQDFFQTIFPPYGSGYLYDAILNLGMSICDGKSLLAMEHTGPSGTYSFSNRSLDNSGLTFGVYHLTVQRNNEDTSVVFSVNLHHLDVDGKWETVPPEPVQASLIIGENENYHSTWAFILSFVLESIAVVFSIGCGVFVFCFQKNRIVSVGQPEFIYMACFGALLIAISGLFLGFDERNGWDEDRLDRKCITMIWLTYLGLITVYMSLFSKLWRVQKVTQMRRRRKVEVKHVLGPFVGVLVLVVVILFCYTFIDPPTWTRKTFLDEETDSGTYGRCEESLWFGMVLDILLGLAVGITVFLAWAVRDLPEDISDAKRIWQTLVAHLLILFVGIIFLAIASFFENQDFYFMSSLLINFLSSVASVFFLVVPKMYYVHVFLKTGEMPMGLQRGRTRVTGLNLPATGQNGNTSNITNSHLMLKKGQNASSMISSGISGLSQSSTSYGRSPSRFGSARWSRHSEINRSGHNFAQSKINEKGSAVPLAMDKNSISLQSIQNSSSSPSVTAINHTGIPFTPDLSHTSMGSFNHHSNQSANIFGISALTMQGFDDSERKDSKGEEPKFADGSASNLSSNIESQDRIVGKESSKLKDDDIPQITEEKDEDIRSILSENSSIANDEKETAVKYENDLNGTKLKDNLESENLEENKDLKSGTDVSIDESEIKETLQSEKDDRVTNASASRELSPKDSLESDDKKQPFNDEAPGDDCDTGDTSTLFA